jgi:hypothetical protein
MKKTLLTCLFFVLVTAGALQAQNQWQPVEGPLPGLQGQFNQAVQFQAVVTLSGGDVLAVSLQGETFSLVNGFGLLQGNQINVGDVIWVSKAASQDFNTSRSNKEKG